VKAPAWWFANKELFLKSMPASVAAMVELHMRGRVEMAVVNGNTIMAESLGAGTLDYCADRGLSRIISTLNPPTNWNENDDESYD
jgi:hypothetical protein